jgi:hypothetical protein
LFIVRAFFHFHSIIQTTFSGQSGIIQKWKSARGPFFRCLWWFLRTSAVRIVVGSKFRPKVL